MRFIRMIWMKNWFDYWGTEFMDADESCYFNGEQFMIYRPQAYFFRYVNFYEAVQFIEITNS
jgi:hypothetical protein